MDLERQYEKLLRYCYMKTKNKELAEDIVQDTYLKFSLSRSIQYNCTAYLQCCHVFILKN